MNYRIFPPDGIIETKISLPLSKSMSARALIINKIGGFDVNISLSDSDDTQALKEAFLEPLNEINIGPAGTAMRFLTAYYASNEGCDVILDGNERMRHRPIRILVEALTKLGADISYIDKDGFPPLHIKGKKLDGGTIELDASVSSQFVSALMMVAPSMKNPLTIVFNGEPTSVPYIKMTAGMMSLAGVDCEVLPDRVLIPNKSYEAPVLHIEHDWSAASYWYSITALSAGWVTLEDMGMPFSLQGDSKMKEYGEKIGVVSKISEDFEKALELSSGPEQHSRLDLDLSGTPDLVQTLAVSCAALSIPFKFTGVHTLKDKETDRLQALKNELDKLGIIIEIENNNTLSWNGNHLPMLEMPRIATYGDHRMAMAFSPLSIFIPGIVIENCQVVSKSYPSFWHDLQNAGFVIEEVD